jgi:signal transduction histidine kinase
MPLGLLIHNISFVACAFLSMVLGIVVYARDTKKKANILFLITSLTFVFYVVSYLWGVNEVNPYRAQKYFAGALVLLFTVCLNAHLAFEMFGQIKTQVKALRVMYGSAFALFVFFITDINRFQSLPTPHEYLPNFFSRGAFYEIFVLFFFIVVIYFFSVIFAWYPKAEPGEKNRIKYFFVAFGWAYIVAAAIFSIVYGQSTIDPIYTALIGLYMVPLAYGVFKYDLLEIHIAARNTILYIFYTTFVASSIVVVNLFNNYLTLKYQDFPLWLLPSLSGLIVVIVGWLVWRQIRQADVLKYEFINNISHKFRTPLTHIRWLAEDLRADMTQAERDKAVEQIQFASMRLFELTNIVIDVSETTNDLYLYHFSNFELKDIIDEIHRVHKDQIDHKKLKVHIDFGPDVPQVKADKTRLQFALQILFENAIIYTPEGGDVVLKVRQIGGEVIISLRDSGIGISEEDITRVFSKFYRSQNARHTDTEGMGIGLFMAKKIIEKHNGRIWAESKGENQGTTFGVALPIQ